MPIDKAFPILRISKNIEKTPDFCWICFAKEKSSSIFARTFAKAEWVAKSKDAATEN